MLTYTRTANFAFGQSHVASYFTPSFSVPTPYNARQSQAATMVKQKTDKEKEEERQNLKREYIESRKKKQEWRESDEAQSHDGSSKVFELTGPYVDSDADRLPSQS